jgi:hypothetical protein
MSKLRAEITYNHRLHNNSLFTEPTIDDTNDANQDPSGNLDNINNPDDNSEEDYSEESDNETDDPQLENEFGGYLQGWIEMLEEEKNAEYDEEGDDINNNIVNINDTTHPAINASAKWALETLFKDNINLPF